jgi:hypothetical protein
MKKLTFGFLAVLVSLIVIFSLYTWITLSWSYSTGERAGLLQKFSKRGWLCKTWEGEHLLTTLPGVVPEKFLFTVRDDHLASQLSAHAGQRLVLKYSQHKGVPSSCFGDTEYFVESFEVLKNE